MFGKGWSVVSLSCSGLFTSVSKSQKHPELIKHKASEFSARARQPIKWFNKPRKKNGSLLLGQTVFLELSVYKGCTGIIFLYFGK